MKQAYEKFNKKGFAVIGFNSDKTEDEMTKFIEEKELEWPQHFMGKEMKTFQDKYWVSGYPTNFLLDHEGKIITRSIRLGHGDAEKQVEKALDELEKSKSKDNKEK